MSRCRMGGRARLSVTIAAVSLSIAIAGCAAFEVEGAFDGLRSLTAIATPANDPPRVFIIHGMTAHGDGYADKLADSLGGNLGLARTSEDNQPLEVPGAIGYGETPKMNLRTYHYSDGERERLRISALNWSPLTESIKQHQFQEDDQLPRALINGEIKTRVMNDGLSDAVLFLGRYQRVMRRGVMIGFCKFLEGDLVYDTCKPNGRSEAPVAFISESLGSYMLLDAIQTLNGTPMAMETSAAGLPLFKRLRVVYMFANQIPQLELSELKEANAKASSSTAISARTRFGAFLDLVRQAHARARANARFAPFLRGPSGELVPLKVVAFTDPNDLLSYRMRPENLPVPAPGQPPSYELANVLSPNELAWFDLFADPVMAHNGYQENGRVLDLVICGSAGCGP